MMDVQQAVDLAKTYVSNLFAQDGLIDPRLEEVEFLESEGVWDVTVGLLRPAREGVIGSLALQLAAIRGENTPGVRVFRSVRIRDADQSVLSVKAKAELY